MHRDWTALTSPPGTSPPLPATPVLLSPAVSDHLGPCEQSPEQAFERATLLISISVLLWYFLISFSALRPHLVFFVFSSFPLSGLVVPSFLILSAFILSALCSFSFLNLSLSAFVGVLFYFACHVCLTKYMLITYLPISVSQTIITKKPLIHIVNLKWNTKEKATHVSESNKPNQNPFDYLWLSKISDCLLLSLYACCPSHYCIFYISQP